MKLDSYDLKILATLQRDGRITKVKLAEAIGLSPSPCWERLRRLEESGLIVGYRAEIDTAKIARLTEVWVEIVLSRNEARDFDRFEKAVAAVPEIVECHAVGGGLDYLMKVVAADIDDYQAIIDRLLAADIGIARYATYIVTKPVKRAAPYPLGALMKRGAGA